MPTSELSGEILVAVDDIVEDSVMVKLESLLETPIGCKSDEPLVRGGGDDSEKYASAVA